MGSEETFNGQKKICLQERRREMQWEEETIHLAIIIYFPITHYRYYYFYCCNNSHQVKPEEVVT